MKFRLPIIALFFCQVLASADLNLDSLGRRVSLFGEWCSPEKIFVHLDRTCYASGETIWFKGYLAEGFVKSRRKPSNFIYVELLDSCGNAVLRHKIKRTDTGFPGSMFIPEDIKTGNYVFRAYSLWQLNSSSEYFFNQQLKIVGARPPVPEPYRDPSDEMDISFYPEGGRYFADHQSVIAFKVMDGDGKSLDFAGSLCDERGRRIASVETRYDGMGKFSFVPSEGHSYYLRTPGGAEYPLPSPSDSGASISLRDNSGVLTAYVDGICDGLCTLVSMNGSEYILLSRMYMDGSTHICPVNPLQTRPGINHLLLLDGYGHILSERKYFIYDSLRPYCTVDSVAISHLKCKPVSAVLHLFDKNGKPLDGNCSMSIYRSAFKRYQQEDGIDSYMSLSSELKGHINEPYHYFDSTVPLPVRQSDMDLLMMVQGWNYYDVEKVTASAEPFKLSWSREYYQIIKGKIMNGKAGRMPKNFSFTLLVPDLNITTVMEVDYADAFVIDSVDFVENTKFLVSINRNGFGQLGRDYIPRWTGDRFALPYRYSLPKGRGRMPLEAATLPVMYEGVVLDTLSAAVVTASGNDPFSIFGRSVSSDEMSRFRDYSLVQYVLYRVPRFEYDGDNMYNVSIRRLSARSSDSGDSEEWEFTDSDDSQPRGTVRLLDDGTPAEWWSYENISIADLKSLSISTEMDQLYQAEGGLVAISLKSGRELDIVKVESLLCFVPLGYQKPSAFYSPRYDKGDSHEVFDHRNTILWQPDVSIVDGHAEITFCDTDQQDYPYYVRMEGVAEDGTPFSGRAVIR